MNASPPVDGAGSLTVSTRARRQQFEQRQRRTSTAIAATSTTAFVVLLVWLLPKTSGWQEVRESFFDGTVFRESFRPILRAFGLDIRIFLVCAPCIVAALPRPACTRRLGGARRARRRHGGARAARPLHGARPPGHR